MKPVQITDKIWWVGVNDRTTPRFENLWPLPHGVSYNSYLIDDEKVALIDGAKSDFFDDYLDHIQHILGEGRKVDYLIVNHMEPDHSSAIELLRRFFPEITVVSNKVALGMLDQFYDKTINRLEVKDGEELNLGTHTLKFVTTPNVHWPETMMTYENSTKTLFSCDGFGSYGALDGSIFEDESDGSRLAHEMRRYYATIVGRFSSYVQKALKKLESVDIQNLCPSHGPVYRNGAASKVIAAYDKMSSHRTEPGAVVIYGTMYGHTAFMAEACAEGLRSKGIKPVKIFDASDTDLSEIIAHVWDNRGLAIFGCCYNMGLFPALLPVLDKLANCKIEKHALALGGCFSWSKGQEMKPLLSFVEETKLELVGDPVEVKSKAKAEELKACFDLGVALAEKILTMSE